MDREKCKDRLPEISSAFCANRSSKIRGVPGRSVVSFLHCDGRGHYLDWNHEAKSCKLYMTCDLESSGPGNRMHFGLKHLVPSRLGELARGRNTLAEIASPNLFGFQHPQDDWRCAYD